MARKSDSKQGTTWTNRIEITSTTDPNKTYILSWKAAEGIWGCSCMRWRMARNGVRDCKHVRAVAGLDPTQMCQVENSLQERGIGTNFGKAIQAAKDALLAAGYMVEDAADELRLQQEAEFQVKGKVESGN